MTYERILDNIDHCTAEFEIKVEDGAHPLHALDGLIEALQAVRNGHDLYAADNPYLEDEE